MEDKLKPKVLVCPMDWGLGHATRCVPIIRKLIEKNAEVIIAADNQPYAFLKKEFPELQFLRFPSYNIMYPANGSMVFNMIQSIPKILSGIRKEHKMLEQITRENDIDVVISDNRYGLFVKNQNLTAKTLRHKENQKAKVYTVFITHQVMIKCPLWMKIFEPVLVSITRRYIKRYDECWVPDNNYELGIRNYEFGNTNYELGIRNYEFESGMGRTEANGSRINLSGDLSHKYKLPENAYYVGLLSRFSNSSGFRVQSSELIEKIDLLIILSGPEPQRTILEEKLVSSLKFQVSSFKNKRVVIVRGKVDESGNRNEELGITQKENESISIYSHLETERLFQLIQSSEIIICRSGYSGIMDMAVMGKKAIFIPTPGQTEQEYLAKYLFDKHLFYYIKQSLLNADSLNKAIKETENYNGIKLNNDGKLLEERIKKVLSVKF